MGLESLMWSRYPHICLKESTSLVGAMIAKPLLRCGQIAQTSPSSRALPGQKWWFEARGAGCDRKRLKPSAPNTGSLLSTRCNGLLLAAAAAAVATPADRLT